MLRPLNVDKDSVICDGNRGISIIWHVSLDIINHHLWCLWYLLAIWLVIALWHVNSLVNGVVNGSDNKSVMIEIIIDALPYRIVFIANCSCSYEKVLSFDLYHFRHTDHWCSLVSRHWLIRVWWLLPWAVTTHYMYQCSDFLRIHGGWISTKVWIETISTLIWLALFANVSNRRSVLPPSFEPFISNPVWRATERECKSWHDNKVRCDSKIRTWILNYIRGFIRDVITHPCPNLPGGLAQSPCKLGNGWVIKSHFSTFM